MTKAFSRLAVIDSRRWIKFLLDLLPRLDDVDFASLPYLEKRMLQMFYVTVWSKAADDWNSDEVLDNLYALADSPVLLGELCSLLQYRYDHIDFIDEPVDLGFECPLDLHCTYTRDQLLVALDFMKPATVREGVKWLPDKKAYSEAWKSYMHYLNIQAGGKDRSRSNPKVIAIDTLLRTSFDTPMQQCFMTRMLM